MVGLPVGLVLLAVDLEGSVGVAWEPAPDVELDFSYNEIKTRRFIVKALKAFQRLFQKF